MVSRWDELSEDVRKHYPWPGRDLMLASGHRLHYLDEGKGEVLLMVHGNPTWSFYFRTLVSALSGGGGDQQSYRCVVPDHIGSGLSDKPQHWSYRLADHAANLVELIDKLDLKDITLVVHDWGGAIGFAAAIQRPERISRLVIFNTSVFMEEVPLSIRLARWKGVGELVVRGANGFLRAGLIRAIGDRSRLREGVGEGYKAPYDSYRDRIAHLRFIRDIPLEEGHPTRTVIDKLTQEVPKLFRDKPAIFIWGDRDFVFTPRFLDRWKELLPKAEVERYPDAAHWVIEDAHERIVPRMRRFLQEHPLQKP